MPENPLNTIFKLDPPLKEYFETSQKFVYADGALPRKFKLLIAMAFDAAQGAEAGVRSLAGQAIEAGATKQEIVEALRVAYSLGGIGSAYIASRGLSSLAGD